MKDLVALLGHLGCDEVTTCIQSGNVVFRAPVRTARRLGRELPSAIEESRGFRPEVLVLDPARLERVVAENPFPEAVEDPKFLHVGFLAAVPERPDLAGLGELREPSERFELIGDHFYMHVPEGVGRSKLAAQAEKRLGVGLTHRNWRTVMKIRHLVEARA